MQRCANQEVGPLCAASDAHSAIILLKGSRENQNGGHWDGETHLFRPNAKLPGILTMLIFITPEDEGKHKMDQPIQATARQRLVNINCEEVSSCLLVSFNT